MAQFQLTVTPVKITTYELRYQIQGVDSPEEAEELWRANPKDPRIELVHQEKLTTGSPRSEVPVLIVASQTAFSFAEASIPLAQQIPEAAFPGE
jgi:hypothetical protein